MPCHIVVRRGHEIRYGGANTKSARSKKVRKGQRFGAEIEYDFELDGVNYIGFWINYSGTKKSYRNHWSYWAFREDSIEVHTHPPKKWQLKHLKQLNKYKDTYNSAIFALEWNGSKWHLRHKKEDE